jgi:hypothetical protein
VTDLTGEVRAAADARLAALEAEVEAAKAGGDPDAIARAVDAVAGVLDGERAWPPEVLTRRDAALAAVAAGRTHVRQLREQREAARADAAWAALTAAYVGDGGVLARLARLQWRAAASAAQRAADASAEEVCGPTAAGLAASLQRAVDHLARVAQAAAAGSLTMAIPGEEEPCPVASFNAEGEEAGFVVKVGPRHQPRPQPVAFASLEAPALQEALTLPGATDQKGDVACVLGWLELARLLERARGYFSSLDPGNDASGVDPTARARAGFGARRAMRMLEAVDQPWAKALHDELAAAALLADAIAAMATQRNLAAAEHAERLLAEHARRLVVVALR